MNSWIFRNLYRIGANDGFDGKIPKGQYGAGEMWIYALGKYEITKDKKDGFYFRLNSKEITGEFRIYKIKNKHITA